MPKLDELDLQETNSTYSAIYWEEASHSWKQYLHRGKYRFFYPDQVDEAIEFLSEHTTSGLYRIYRHDTTRER